MLRLYISCLILETLVRGYVNKLFSLFIYVSEDSLYKTQAGFLDQVHFPVYCLIWDYFFSYLLPLWGGGI